MSANTKRKPRAPRRATPKAAQVDQVFQGPVVVGGTDTQPTDYRTGLPAVIPAPEPIDVSAALEAMATVSRSMNRRRPFMGLGDLVGIACTALAVKLTAVALIALF